MTLSQLTTIDKLKVVIVFLLYNVLIVQVHYNLACLICQYVGRGNEILPNSKFHYILIIQPKMYNDIG